MILQGSILRAKSVWQRWFIAERLKTFCLPRIILMLGLTSLHAQTREITDGRSNTKRVYITSMISSENTPVIDGQINEMIWNQVPWSEYFIEYKPNQNNVPKELSRFKILYDLKNLYVAIQCFDSKPLTIEKRLSRKDGFEGDWVEIDIDSYNDKRTAFAFTITAAGIRGDELVTNNGDFDASWDPIWQAKAHIDDKGWTSEMKIPLSQLRFGKSREQEWGIQLRRKLFRETIYSTWQGIAVNAPGWVSEFGILRGLKGLIPQKQFEIQPYILSQFKSYPKKSDNPFGDGFDKKIQTGLDAKIGISNDLTLDVAVNPDFGQVEADPSAISLDGFQLFFEEQRPFFVENKNIFTYKFRNNLDNLFYSRRIGRKPEAIDPKVQSLNLHLPPSTTIPIATKFSGKTENGWSVGVLEAVTAREYARTQDITNTQDKILVEPFTNYFVGRLQKDSKSRNTYIGGIITATHRKIEPPVALMHTSAYSGGIDFKHNWGNRNYFIEGSFVASHISGSTDAIEATQRSIGHLFNRSDASYINVDPSRTSLSGTGGKIAIGKVGGGHFQYLMGLDWVSPELELNDLGFLRHSDEIIQSSFFGYKTLKPFSAFREISATFNQSSSFDFGGMNNTEALMSEINATFKSNWETTLAMGFTPRNFINSYLRGGPKWRNSPEFNESLQVGSDPRKKLNVLVEQRYYQSLQQDFSSHIYVTSLGYQPLNSIGVSLDTQYERYKTLTQYVSQQTFENAIRYITAQLDNETLSISLRLQLTLSPNLTIQYYGQPFISRGKYGRYNYVINPQAKYVDKRVNVYQQDQISVNSSDNSIIIDENRDGRNDYTFSNPEFSLVQFRSNLVVRWEYITGSEVFLVWSQGLNESVNTDSGLLTSLRSAIRPQKIQNILLVKLTYRFTK